MAHIDLPEGLPGISAAMAFRPETAGPLRELAEVLLRGESSLTRAEREIIAAYVSWLNDCHFCQTSHGAFAAVQLPGGWEAGWEVVDAVKVDPTTAPVSAKVRALLAIAEKVQKSGRHVTGELVDAARRAGASDQEIHDAVLIAAAFCMFNRYVDGLAAFTPQSREDYRPMAERITAHGYVRSVEQQV